MPTPMAIFFASGDLAAPPIFLRRALSFLGAWFAALGFTPASPSSASSENREFSSAPSIASIDLVWGRRSPAKAADALPRLRADAACEPAAGRTDAPADAPAGAEPAPDAAWAAAAAPPAAGEPPTTPGAPAPVPPSSAPSTPLPSGAPQNGQLFEPSCTGCPQNGQHCISESIDFLSNKNGAPPKVGARHRSRRSDA